VIYGIKDTQLGLKEIYFKKELNFFRFYNKSLKRRSILDTSKIKQDGGVVFFYFENDESIIF